MIAVRGREERCGESRINMGGWVAYLSIGISSMKRRFDVSQVEECEARGSEKRGFATKDQGFYC